MNILYPNGCPPTHQQIGGIRTLGFAGVRGRRELLGVAQVLLWVVLAFVIGFGEGRTDSSVAESNNIVYWVMKNEDGKVAAVGHRDAR